MRDILPYLLHFSILGVFIVLFFISRHTNKKWLKINFYLGLVANTINSVRYGNLAAKLDEAGCPSSYRNVTDSVNRMIETLNDREKMIVEYQTELMRGHKMLEDFVATLAHDMKVPIIAQTNVVNFLLEGKFGEINEKQKTALENMQISNGKLIELVHTLLETYKINEQGITLAKEHINLNTLLSDIVREMQHVSGNITINFEPSDYISTYADPLQLERVVKNLISNAISHSNTREKIDIALTQDSDAVLISVIDYGQGIPQDEIEMIFNKYYSATNKLRSTGLGLYLSRQIIQSHGGEIAVTSEENIRTEFCIKLPL